MIERTKRANTRHGGRSSHAYRIWQGMMTRCTNPNAHEYPDYGGRGIAVCERWQSFASFWADMGDPPVGMTLGRRDNNGGYSPENCRWETAIQQARNRRSNRLLTHMGITLTLAEWAEKYGMPAGRVGKRLASGWTLARALSTPIVQSFVRRKPALAGGKAE